MGGPAAGLHRLGDNKWLETRILVPRGPRLHLDIRASGRRVLLVFPGQPSAER